MAMGRATSEGGRPRTIRIGHSPDPDDAFMFYGLASGRVPTPGYAVAQVLDDIESLNRLALDGAIVVARAPVAVEDLKTMTIAVPGRLTSATLALRLALGEVRTEVVAFDRIP